MFQPTSVSGIALYNAGGNTIRNLYLPTAAGFAFYDGTPTSKNYWL